MKKLTAKEKRELEKAKRLQKGEQAEKAKQERERLAAQQAKEAQEKKEREKKAKRIQQFEVRFGGKEVQKKSNAKTAGLKSTFILSDDKLLMTSFGKGSVAYPEKYIDNKGKRITNANPVATLDVSPEGEQFRVSGRLETSAIVYNPLEAHKTNSEYTKRQPGSDLIYCREKLEKIYFGQNFKDNIHIQLIYSILDIEKILSVHVNNIVFELDNLLRREDEEHDDLIGYMSLANDYNDFKTSNKKNGKELYQLFQELISKPQLGYFGREFVPVLTEEGELDEEYEKRMYYLLALLGEVRQATAHGDIGIRATLYKLEDSCKDKRIEAKKYLQDLYSKRIHDLNEDFLSLAKKDLHILFKVFHVQSENEQKELAKKYYSFVVTKEYKNQGFSIRKLREQMIEHFASGLRDDTYNSIRSKMYRFIDFVITEHYQKEEKRSEQLVEALRASANEVEKMEIYYEEAEYLYPEISSIIENEIVPRMDGDAIGNMQVEKLDQNFIKEAMVPETAHVFSEMIYLLTRFLDGKEINDLLTQLINKFENIISFFDVLKNEGMSEPKLCPDYQMFTYSEEIVKELRLINSVARMSKADPSAKRIMFIEAAEILGYDADEKTLKRYIDAVLSKKENLKTEFHIKDNGFRNFIISNVIESTRFKYLVRYGNPKKLRSLAKNEIVVRFVLNDIPDEMIRFYYNSCYGVRNNFEEEMREYLKDEIIKLRFNDFQNVKAGNDLTDSEIEKKERKKNIVRLYLTVLYLILKNMVYINSRYFLAFHCLERDFAVYDYNGSNKSENEWIKLREDYASFSNRFLEQHPHNKRANKYILENMKYADPWAMRAYRNCIDHLNAIRNADKYIGDIKSFSSYYELYHYLVQRSIMDQYVHDSTHPSRNGGMIISEDRVNPSIFIFFGKVAKYHSYCKDFVKALNIPFAYNLPRYKNLSINELFDRNNYLHSKRKHIEILLKDE